MVVLWWYEGGDVGFRPFGTGAAPIPQAWVLLLLLPRLLPAVCGCQIPS